MGKKESSRSLEKSKLIQEVPSLPHWYSPDIHRIQISHSALPLESDKKYLSFAVYWYLSSTTDRVPLFFTVSLPCKLSDDLIKTVIGKSVRILQPNSCLLLVRSTHYSARPLVSASSAS